MSYDPEIWQQSLVRELKRYMDNALSVQPYSSAYEVVMEFPAPVLEARKVPLDKTMIHFEIDEIVNRVIGFGEGIFADNFNATDSTISPQSAMEHRVNFDVGIWAFDKSGGITSRMRAYELLTDLFGFPTSIDRLRNFTDAGDGALEILSFSGGRYVNDTVNDVPVYRSVNGTLEIRVFSRTAVSSEPITAIESIGQNPGLTIIG